MKFETKFANKVNSSSHTNLIGKSELLVNEPWTPPEKFGVKYFNFNCRFWGVFLWKWHLLKYRRNPNKTTTSWELRQKLCILALKTQSTKIKSNGMSEGWDQSVSLQLFNTVEMFDKFFVFWNIKLSISHWHYFQWTVN